MLFTLTKLAIVVASIWPFYEDPVAATKCKNPAVRKEWRKLSVHERTDWIRAMNCLSHLPHDNALAPTVKPTDIVAVNTSGSYYDDIVYMHMDLNHVIHFTGLFLPWHRWYVHSLESALKSKCGFAGSAPYWNWSMDAADLYGSTFFADDDPHSGLGGWGDPSHDFQVPTGGFSDFHVSYPSPHTLRRNFTLRPFESFKGVPLFSNSDLMANISFTKAEVDKMVGGFEGDFKGFQQYFETFQGAHASVHMIMGGDLAGQCPINAPASCVSGSPTFSVNEPLFFMHHAMVDKVWSDWQHKHQSNFWSYQGGSVQALSNLTEYNAYPNGMPPALTLDSVMPADGIFPQATIRDVMDTTGGYLCYVYE